jgi:hypothetical protein
MSNSITFKTEVQLHCCGFQGFCKKDVWVPAVVVLESVVTIPQDLDSSYEHDLYVAHTQDVQCPNDWYQQPREEWMCQECALKRNSYNAKEADRRIKRKSRAKQKRLQESGTD